MNITKAELENYKNQLEKLESVDFTTIMNAIGAEAEQALEDCIIGTKRLIEACETNSINIE